MELTRLQRTLNRGLRLLATSVALVLWLLPADHADSNTPGQTTIDFELAAVPLAMRPAIAEAVVAKPIQILAAQRVAVVSLQRQGDWALATLAALDGNPEAVAMGNGGALIVLDRKPDGSWVAGLEGTPAFAQLLPLAPDNVLDPAAKQAFLPTGIGLSSPQEVTVTLKFPWDHSQRWYFTQGWHYGNNVDFAPAWSEPNKWVLAAHDGTVTRLCLGPLTANLRVKHSSGLITEYAHLDKNTVPASMLGKTVAQGRMLGKAYNAAFTSAQDPCGYSTGPHVHFLLPSQTVTVDGWTAHPDNTWTNGTTTKRLNAAFNSTNVLNEGITPRTFIPLLPHR